MPAALLAAFGLLLAPPSALAARQAIAVPPASLPSPVARTLTQPRHTTPSSAAQAFGTQAPGTQALVLPADAALTVDPKFADQPVVELYHLRDESVNAAGLSTQTVQRLFAIVNQEGASIFGVDDIWYDGSRSRFTLLRAEIVRHGVVIAHGSDAGDAETGATGNRPRHLLFPKLHAGDRVDIVYTLTPLQPAQWKVLGGHYLGDLFAFRGGYPVQKVLYRLRSAAQLSVAQVRLAPPEHRQLPDGTWQWEWTGGPYQAFYREEDGPSITDSAPFVQVSGFHSWTELANWYQAELERRSQLTPAFKARLLQLVPPQATPEQTVNAVWTYLSHHLRYVGNETGLHAFLPTPVEQTFAAQQGDCKDGSLLFSTWLRAEGVPARLALVRTRAMGTLADGAPTMAAFDHAIVYLPTLNRWLDTTVPEFHFHEVPSSDQDGLALVVDGATTQLINVPEATARENRTVRSLRLTPDGSGWYQAKGEISVQGADAPSFREDYGPAATRRVNFQNWLRRSFPNAQLDSLHVHGLRAQDTELVLRFTARIPRAALRAGTPTRPAWRASWTPRHYTQALASQAARSSDLDLPLRWSTDETWMVQTPLCQTGGRHGRTGSLMQVSTRGDADSGDADAGTPLEQSSRFGQVRIDQSCSQGWLKVHTLVVQNSQSVRAADYSGFRNFWTQVDHELSQPLFASSLELRRDPSGDATSAVAERSEESAAPSAGAAQ